MDADAPFARSRRARDAREHPGGDKALRGGNTPHHPSNQRRRDPGGRARRSARACAPVARGGLMSRDAAPVQKRADIALATVTRAVDGAGTPEGERGEPAEVVAHLLESARTMGAYACQAPRSESLGAHHSTSGRLGND